MKIVIHKFKSNTTEVKQKGQMYSSVVLLQTTIYGVYESFYNQKPKAKTTNLTLWYKVPKN